MRKAVGHEQRLQSLAGRARVVEPAQVGLAQAQRLVELAAAQEGDEVGLADHVDHRLAEVETRRKIHVEAEESRRAPHQVGAFVNAVGALLGARGGGRKPRPENRPKAIDGPTFLVDEKKRRRGPERPNFFDE
jgi:hypothetical protein